jgi:hypothetical protein
MTAVTDEPEAAPKRRWRWVLAAVGIVSVLIVGIAVYALVLIWSQKESTITGYSVIDETTLYAYVETGSGESFAGAFAEESSTTVTLHVQYRQPPGTYPGPAWMAGERIALESPLGDRTVLNASGDRLRRQPYDPMPTLQEMADWATNGQTGSPPIPPKGRLEGTVLMYGGPRGEDGTSAVNGEPAVRMPVRVRNESTGQVIEDVSNKRGEFWLPLPAGDYTLLCAPEVPFTVEDGNALNLTCKVPVP